MNFMLQTRRRRFALYALTIVAGMVVSCLVLAVIGYNSNQKLPSGPEITDRMTPLDKVRLEEALHLKSELGDAVWPGYAGLTSARIHDGRQLVAFATDLHKRLKLRPYRPQDRRHEGRAIGYFATLQLGAPVLVRHAIRHGLLELVVRVSRPHVDLRSFTVLNRGYAEIQLPYTNL